MPEILGEIEKVREFMHKQGMLKGMRHPDVLKISQEIDVLLNKYYQLL
jgi:hypothetical protein